MVTVVVTPFLIFGGFFLSIRYARLQYLNHYLIFCNFRSIPAYLTWLADFSWFKYGNSALLINQWMNVTNIICNGNTSTCLNNGEIVLESLGVDQVNLYWQKRICVFSVKIASRCIILFLLRSLFLRQIFHKEIFPK